MVKVVKADRLAGELGTILDDVARGHEVVLTRRGHRRAVLIDHSRLRALQELACIGRDDQARAAIARSDDDVRSGRVYGLKGRPTVRRILALGSSGSRTKRVG